MHKNVDFYLKIFNNNFMRFYLIFYLVVSGLCSVAYSKSPIVLMTDFGLQDGAVSSMKGVILGVDQDATISDLTHYIEPFNIKEAAYRLQQVMEYYPKGTVFVCVVDPGVGTKRKSIVAKLKNGYFFVGPDNGILTYVARMYGVLEVREIDQKTNRLVHTNSAYETFHGRDIFAFTGARLASDVISFEQTGEISNGFVTFEILEPKIKDSWLIGSVVVLDSVYGNLWTNINIDTAKKANLGFGKSVIVEIYNTNKLVYSSTLSFVEAFGEVQQDVPLLYINSLGNLAVALNQGNFAKKYNIKPGYYIKLKLTN